MQNKKIILAGGSGFIGEGMIRYFGKENELVVLTRQLNHSLNNRNNYHQLSPTQLKNVRFVIWDGKTAGSWAKELEDAYMIINLAGKSVNCRYTAKNKQEIFDSRTDSVKAIGQAINKCGRPSQIWINASSATIYRDARDVAQDDYTGEIGKGFSVDVCRLWEKTFYDQITPYTRKIALRMAITLRSGGVLIPYFNLLKFGLGGRQGSGKQMYSWIHLEDTCRMIEWIAGRTEMEGTYNCAAPNPVTNAEFMKTLRNITGTKFGLPAFTWMLKMGSWLIGTETELVLKSRWVLPAKIQDSGFEFKYPLLKTALKQTISQVPPKQYRLL